MIDSTVIRIVGCLWLLAAIGEAIAGIFFAYHNDFTSLIVGLLCLIWAQTIDNGGNK
jgi:1,4-dihydroxy-2-naphthoate octaprenyltransferase